MSIIRSIMKYARKQVGKPYVFGRAGPDAFDCSGYVKAAFAQAGIILYHGASTMDENGFKQGDPRKYGYWGKHGEIDTLPRLRFCVLFNRSRDDPSKMAHTGLYIRGMVFQAGGYGGTGVHKGKVDTNHWTDWRMLRRGLRKDLKIANKMPETIRYGAKGELVKTLQNLLNQYGYGLVVDGAFGKLTKASVVDYQAKNGLEADGIVGFYTWKALLADNQNDKQSV